MTRSYSFVIPEIVPCPRHRTTKTGHTYQTKEIRDYKARVALLAALAIKEPITGYWSARIRVFTRNRRKFDLDNVVKGIQDAIVQTGGVPDDCRLWEYPELFRCLTTGEERVEVEVSEIEPREEAAE